MNWYAIRTIYHFGVKANGINVFEERIVGFSAASSETAHSKAEVESAAYAAQNGFIAHSEQMSYQQDGSPLLDGYELWSELFEARCTLDEFYALRYGKFLYEPELPNG